MGTSFDIRRCENILPQRQSGKYETDASYQFGLIAREADSFPVSRPRSAGRVMLHERTAGSIQLRRREEFDVRCQIVLELDRDGSQTVAGQRVVPDIRLPEDLLGMNHDSDFIHGRGARRAENGFDCGFCAADDRPGQHGQ